MRLPARFLSSSRVRRSLAGFMVLVAAVWPGATLRSDTFPTSKGAVATVHPLATDAAVRAAQQGGNAIDAAVAAALTLGVVDGFNSGIGGGCFLLIRLADGSTAAIDGRETAPAAATRDMFLRDGKADARLSQTGALAAGVPGALAAYDYAVRRFGKLSLRRLLLSGAELAEKGFELNRTYADRLAGAAEALGRFESSRTVFLKPDGSTFRAGEQLRQPDLATTYRAIAEQGLGWFYNGPFAVRTAAWMVEQGGRVTSDDFAQYRLRRREPVRTTYRGYEIIGFPPPSSGGVHVAQILNILEPFALKNMGPDSAEFVHVVAEAMKLAFADRAHWLGDPDFVSVPRGLTDKAYARGLGSRLQRDRVIDVPAHGTPPRADEDIFGKHTTHFSTADADGNWVACTATINTTFGSKVVVPGTGVVLNNQMDDFAAQPGVANFFGLVGSEANAVAPRKRPLSSMSPTLVLKDGRVLLALGAAGGPTIISQTLLTILYWIDFGLSAEEALARPRFHHQWQPNELRVEKKMGADVVRELERRGHKVKAVDSIGATQIVGWDPKKQAFLGAADPRTEGKAAGF